MDEAAFGLYDEVYSMDVGPSNGNDLKLAMAMYRYASVFLDYLDAAETLLDLEGSLPVVEPARDLVANGRDVFGDYDEVSAAMERVLNPRRSIDKLMEGLKYAVGRFDVDLELARADESRMWEALVDAVGSVPRNESWENEDGWIWYRGDMEGQRGLLIEDEKSADRVRYYRRELRQTLFDYVEHMPSPDALEVDYRVFFGKLVDTVPFAIPADILDNFYEEG